LFDLNSPLLGEEKEQTRIKPLLNHPLVVLCRAGLPCSSSQRLLTDASPSCRWRSFSFSL